MESCAFNKTDFHFEKIEIADEARCAIAPAESEEGEGGHLGYWTSFVSASIAGLATVMSAVVNYHRTLIAERPDCTEHVRPRFEYFEMSSATSRAGGHLLSRPVR
jgi:hypothetical protein